MRACPAARLPVIAVLLWALLPPSVAGATSIELVKDVYPGDNGPPLHIPWSSQLHGLTVVGGHIFFAATNTYGTELWKTDGTTAGTVMVKNINTSPAGVGDAVDASSNPLYLADIGGTLFFSAELNGSTGPELWKSDGTSGGTVLVADIATVSGSAPQWITDVNSIAFFSADDGVIGRELYSSSGSTAGLVANLNTAMLAGSDPRQLTEIGGKLFFTADDGSHGKELWIHDPGAVLTTRLDINFGVGPSAPVSLTDVGGTLYFGATDGSSGQELWKSDGTVDGTTRVKDIQLGGGSSNPLNLIDFNGVLFFAADGGTNGMELWKSDGTELGTERVTDINPDSANAFDPFVESPMVVVGSTLYFTADDGSHGVELWKTDGTTEGTMLVKDINDGGDANIGGLTDVDGVLYFVANDGSNGREVWKSNGTTAGTMMVGDLAPGSLSAFPSGDVNVISFDGSLFFAATNGDGFFSGDGVELWRTSTDFVDSDEDDMDDDWEDANGLDSTYPDGGEDLDMDGVTNLAEFENDLLPWNPDTDGDGIGDAFDKDPVASNACLEDMGGDAVFDTSVPAGTTVQCAASHSIAVDLDVSVSEAGGHLELISPAVSVSDGFTVGSGNQLVVINADPVPGVLVDI
jgi:ELWxxDGT repeat protein